MQDILLRLTFTVSTRVHKQKHKHKNMLHVIQGEKTVVFQLNSLNITAVIYIK